MASLIQLYEEQGQSPWLDNLTRAMLRDGTMAGLVARGVRGVTANPTIVARAIESSDAYDQQFHDLLACRAHRGGRLLGPGRQRRHRRARAAAADLRHSEGADGFVSIEVAPDLANDMEATMAAARDLHERIGEPNLLVKIPATSAGVPAIEAMFAEGRSINVTLIFSLGRYARCSRPTCPGWRPWPPWRRPLRRPQRGLVLRQPSRHRGRPPTGRRSGPPRRWRCGAEAAVAQAKLAYQLFRERYTGPALGTAGRPGARVQRPLWASTSTKNPAYPDTLYVDNLIGPDTVNTLPESTLRGLRGPRHACPHDRHRRREAEPSCGPSPRRGSTWTMSGTPSRRRASTLPVILHPRARHLGDEGDLEVACPHHCQVGPMTDRAGSAMARLRRAAARAALTRAARRCCGTSPAAPPLWVPGGGW